MSLSCIVCMIGYPGLIRQISFVVCIFNDVLVMLVQVAPYERPALSKAYLFPEGELFQLILLITNRNCITVKLVLFNL